MRSFIWVLLMSSVVVVGSGRHVDAKMQEPQAVEPAKGHMVGGVGQDWDVLSFELPPGAIHSWQSRPRGEFLYILEGAGRLQVEGRPAITLSAGAASTLTSLPQHVLKNTSRTKPLKILVVFFNEKEPHPLVHFSLVQGSQGKGTGSHDRGGTSPAGIQQKSGDIGLVF
jgi:quercetin dioxygenase-like cupin family protein